MELESTTNILDNHNRSIKNMIENDGNELKERVEKCEKWLAKCSVSTDCDVSDSCSIYSDSDGSVLTETTADSAMESGFVFQNKGVVIGDRILSKNDVGSTAVIIKENKDIPKYDNVNIYKSKKVHVGDVTYINGPVIISNGNGTSAYNDKVLPSPSPYIDRHADFLVNRINWLAQPPLGEYEYHTEPAKYIIITHTATEEGFSQADNTLLVRLIQTFHVECRKWKDVAYNFLIGSDGLIYEGRGWGVVGSHTRNYNSKSVGIAFIGCFIKTLPPKASLDKAKELIEVGITKGSISPDYKLLAHCQCAPTESPGRRLFEEIKTWPNWDSSIAVAKSNFTCEIDEPPDDPDENNAPDSKVAE